MPAVRCNYIHNCAADVSSEGREVLGTDSWFSFILPPCSWHSWEYLIHTRTKDLSGCGGFFKMTSTMNIISWLCWYKSSPHAWFIWMQSSKATDLLNSTSFPPSATFLFYFCVDRLPRHLQASSTVRFPLLFTFVHLEQGFVWWVWIVHNPPRNRNAKHSSIECQSKRTQSFLKKKKKGHLVIKHSKHEPPLLS